MNKKVIFALTMSFVLSALAVTPLFAQVKQEPKKKNTLEVKRVEPLEYMEHKVPPASVKYNQGGMLVQPDTTQTQYRNLRNKIFKQAPAAGAMAGTASFVVPEASNIVFAAAISLGKIPLALPINNKLALIKLFINAINKKDDKAFNEAYMSSAPSLALKANTKNLRVFRKEALENTFACLEPVGTQEEKTALALSIDPENVDAFMSLYENIYKNQSGEERTQLIQNTFAQFKVKKDCESMLSEE